MFGQGAYGAESSTKADQYVGRLADETISNLGWLFRTYAFLNVTTDKYKTYLFEYMSR